MAVKGGRFWLPFRGQEGDKSEFSGLIVKSHKLQTPHINGGLSVIFLRVAFKNLTPHFFGEIFKCGSHMFSHSAMS